MTIALRDFDDKLRRLVNLAKSGNLAQGEIVTSLNTMASLLGSDTTSHDVTVQPPPAGMAPISPPGKGVPACTAPPTITGSTSVGSTLTCSNGSWTNSPSSYAFQWMRSGSVTGAAAIAGATSSTYVIVAADQTHRLGCRVTAIANGIGGSSSSNQVGPI